MTETARDLVSEGRCTPNCLLSGNDEADKCTCRCGGEFHALLADAPLNFTPDPDQVTSVRRGDVVAIGQHNGECPVGLVEAVDRLGIRLVLMDAGWGTFTLGPRFVPWRQIAEMRHAAEETDEEATRLGRAFGDKNAKIYATQPLSEFQTWWTLRSGAAPCAFCGIRIKHGRMAFWLAEGLCCTRCVDKRDLYDRILPPPATATGASS